MFRYDNYLKTIRSVRKMITRHIPKQEHYESVIDGESMGGLESRLPYFAQINGEGRDLIITLTADELGRYAESVNPEEGEHFRKLLRYCEAESYDPKKPNLKSVDLIVLDYAGQSIEKRDGEDDKSIRTITGADWAKSCWREMWGNIEQSYTEERAPPREDKLKRTLYLKSDEILPATITASLLVGGGIGDLIWFSNQSINPDVIGLSMMVAVLAVNLPTYIYMRSLHKKSPITAQENYSKHFKNTPIDIIINEAYSAEEVAKKAE